MSRCHVEIRVDRGASVSSFRTLRDEGQHSACLVADVCARVVRAWRVTILRDCDGVFDIAYSCRLMTIVVDVADQCASCSANAAVIVLVILTVRHCVKLLKRSRSR